MVTVSASKISWTDIAILVSKVDFISYVFCFVVCCCYYHYYDYYYVVVVVVIGYDDGGTVVVVVVVMLMIVNRQLPYGYLKTKFLPL